MNTSEFASDDAKTPPVEIREQLGPKATKCAIGNGNSTTAAGITKDSKSVINVDDVPSDKLPLDIGVFSEVLRRDDNFRYPRRILAETNFPDVDGLLTSYTVSSSGSILQDLVTVKKLPPQSVLENIAKELAASRDENSEVIVKIPSYGDFNSDGIRILQRYHRLKRLRAEVSFEKKWIKNIFKTTLFEEKVTRALLDRWNLEGKHLASYNNYSITSQELSLLCGERYLTDEIMNLLGLKYCDRANKKHQACQNVLLPSFLATGNCLDSVVTNICLNHDMASVVNMFLPVHMQDKCHWGLAIFSFLDNKVFFDDGYHCAIPEHLKHYAAEIIDIIYQTTSNDNFKPSKWYEITRFKVPMPDQPGSSCKSTTGCGSCGVAVICSIRDICNGESEAFTWTYQDAPRLRAELILELLDLSS